MGRDALELLTKDHKIHSVDNVVLMSKVLDSSYPKKKEYVLDRLHILLEIQHIWTTLRIFIIGDFMIKRLFWN